MPLLDRGALAPDPFTTLADDAPLPSGEAVIVSLARLMADTEALRSHDAPVGVALAAADAPDTVADALSWLALIVLELPRFRDGRAFSQARALRERLGYAGLLRARGHILPDQAQFLARVGVDQIIIPDGADLAAWQTGLNRYTVAYQPGLTASTPLGALRRRLG
jgi:uncharacterized protein (DUF934 family)